MRIIVGIREQNNGNKKRIMCWGLHSTHGVFSICLGVSVNNMNTSDCGCHTPLITRSNTRAEMPLSYVPLVLSPKQRKFTCTVQNLALLVHSVFVQFHYSNCDSTFTVLRTSWPQLCLPESDSPWDPPILQVESHQIRWPIMEDLALHHCYMLFELCASLRNEHTTITYSILDYRPEWLPSVLHCFVAGKLKKLGRSWVNFRSLLPSSKAWYVSVG